MTTGLVSSPVQKQAEWDGYIDDDGEPVYVQLQVVNLHCPMCARHGKDGQQKAGDYALCMPCAQRQRHGTHRA